MDKTHPLIRAFGDVDELDAALGLAVATAPKSATKRALRQLQHELFALKSDLATPQLSRKQTRRITKEDVARLEARIDELEAALPELKRFIAYGGTPCAAHLQLARAIARRAERSAWQAKEGSDLNEHVTVYLNRLSDYLFLLARKANLDEGHAEEEMRLPPG